MIIGGSAFKSSLVGGVGDDILSVGATFTSSTITGIGNDTISLASGVGGSATITVVEMTALLSPAALRVLRFRLEQEMTSSAFQAVLPLTA